MSNLSIDLSSGNGTPYELHCTNNSSAPWVFYVYQKMPTQPKDIFSLAWFASPITVTSGASVLFKWDIDYSFVWSRTGVVVPGVQFSAGQVIPCSPSVNNQTTFSALDNTPKFSTAIPGGTAGSLTIHEAGSVPNNVYTTGIGMSGQGSFVRQGLANTKQLYTPEPKYYIAAGISVQMGQVLAETVTMSAGVEFPANVYKMFATLDNEQIWKISTSPNE